MKLSQFISRQVTSQDLYSHRATKQDYPNLIWFQNLQSFFTKRKNIVFLAWLRRSYRNLPYCQYMILVNFRLALKDSFANLLLEKINLLGLSGREWKAVKEDRRCFFKLKPSTTGKEKMKALQNNKDDFFVITRVLSLSYRCFTSLYRISKWRHWS